MKPALLVIDVQNDFFEISPETAKSLDAAIQNINNALQLFRDKNLPIICIQHIDEKDNLIPGQTGFDLPDALKITNTDTTIHKTYGNSFNKTNLKQILNELDVDTVIVSGFCAEYCVLSTYRGAQDNDLTPVILRNALASIKLENIKFVESVSEIISLGALRQALS